MNKLEYLEMQMELTISPMDFLQYKKQHQNDYLLVDIRNAPPHLKKEKIEGAIELPLSELEQSLDTLAKDKLIVVYCWDVWCNMAKKASIILLKNGFTVKELSGGISAWNQLNLPTESLV